MSRFRNVAIIWRRLNLDGSLPIRLDTIKIFHLVGWLASGGAEAWAEEVGPKAVGETACFSDSFCSSWLVGMQSMLAWRIHSGTFKYYRR